LIKKSVESVLPFAHLHVAHVELSSGRCCGFGGDTEGLGNILKVLEGGDGFLLLLLGNLLLGSGLFIATCFLDSFFRCALLGSTLVLASLRLLVLFGTDLALEEDFLGCSARLLRKRLLLQSRLFEHQLLGGDVLSFNDSLGLRSLLRGGLLGGGLLGSGLGGLGTLFNNSLLLHGLLFLLSLLGFLLGGFSFLFGNLHSRSSLLLSFNLSLGSSLVGIGDLFLEHFLGHGGSLNTFSSNLGNFLGGDAGRRCLSGVAGRCLLRRYFTLAVLGSLRFLTNHLGLCLSSRSLALNDLLLKDLGLRSSLSFGHRRLLRNQGFLGGDLGLSHSSLGGGLYLLGGGGGLGSSFSGVLRLSLLDLRLGDLLGSLLFHGLRDRLFRGLDRCVELGLRHLGGDGPFAGVCDGRVSVFTVNGHRLGCVVSSEHRHSDACVEVKTHSVLFLI